MVKVERIAQHIVPVPDGIMFVGRYRIEGQKRILRCEVFGTSEMEGDPDCEAAMWCMADEQAQWAAEHPSQVGEIAGLELT